MPSRAELPARLASVLRTVYLLFNEGYLASSGEKLIRADLSAEAMRLARLLVALLDEPEALGLLALMLLHESRRTARATSVGEIVLLDDGVTLLSRDATRRSDSNVLEYLQAHSTERRYVT